jgi:flagellar hook-associated protein 2
MTLRQLADAINERTYTGSIKAQASVINTGTSASPSFKLVLMSTATGADYGITINADDSTLDLDQAQGADSDSDGQYRVDIQAAQNALFKVNGLQVTKSSNTVSDVITGVTFTIKQESTTQVNLTVQNDADAIKKKVEDFVTAYNNVVNLISSKSTYDTTAKKGGPLNAEATAKSIINKLRSMLVNPVSGLGSEIDSLAEIGITTNSKDGTLTVNTATLSAKLSSNLEEVADIFTSTGNGIAVKVTDYVADITGSSGALTGRTKGLQSVINDISSDIRRIESRLAYKEQALRRQYAALESLLSGFSAQGSFLSSQMSKW